IYESAKGVCSEPYSSGGCIAERYIAKEAVEFCTEHLSDVSTVGVPSSQKMGVSKPLSGCTVQSELNEEEHNGISENLRWLAASPSMAVPSYRSYLINDNTSGLVVDELGFTFVDLSKIGHRNDQFVMASQVKQVFYVDDPMYHGWSVVLSMPNREYNNVIGDDVLGDIRIECETFTREIPNVDTYDDLVALGMMNQKLKKLD
ncbi:hypothetical protein Prudu_117S000300, partial [Prunus dulcis]